MRALHGRQDLRGKFELPSLKHTGGSVASLKPEQIAFVTAALSNLPTIP
jgi:hypothetical protein